MKVVVVEAYRLQQSPSSALHDYLRKQNMRRQMNDISLYKRVFIKRVLWKSTFLLNIVMGVETNSRMNYITILKYSKKL